MTCYKDVAFILPPHPDLDSGSHYGGIAISRNGEFFADVATRAHCVRIYTLSDDGHSTICEPVVFGNPGVFGADDSHMSSPRRACFVTQEGQTTTSLLIADSCNDRIVEITSSGVFIRALEMPKISNPTSVAYCRVTNTIAVSTQWQVTLLNYGSLLQTATFSRPWLYTHIVCFPFDGSGIYLGDYLNGGIRKLDIATGKVITLWVTNKTMCDLAIDDDGGVFITADGKGKGKWLQHIKLDGEMLIDSGYLDYPNNFKSIAFSSKCHSLIYKDSTNGEIRMLKDTWFDPMSARSAWILAACL